MVVEKPFKSLHLQMVMSIQSQSIIQWCQSCVLNLQFEFQYHLQALNTLCKELHHQVPFACFSFQWDAQLIVPPLATRV